MSKERMIATLPGVRASVGAVQNGIHAKARALFAAHDHPGGIRLTKRRYTIDAWVYLEGEGATPFELGHIQSGAYAGKLRYGPERFVPGAHVLGRAARG